MQRLNSTLDQWQNVIRGGHTCIAGWDSNLDMLENNDPLDRYDTREMLEQYTQFISDNSLVQHNHEPTRHMVGQRSTLIDQFISNCPEHINGVQTLRSHIADHDMVNINFHTKDLQLNPQFTKIRDTRNLKRENIVPTIENNIQINSIFSMTCPNKIAKVLIEELNKVIEYLAPSKIVQVRKDHQPYINEETRDYIKLADTQLNCAISSNDVEEWRIYKYMRNRITEIIEASKLVYYTKILVNSKDMWRTIKNCTKVNPSTIPRLIISNGETITSPKKLADLANCHFKEKINKIRAGFQNCNFDILGILRKLIPKKNADSPFLS